MTDLTNKKEKRWAEKGYDAWDKKEASLDIEIEMVNFSTNAKWTCFVNEEMTPIIYTSKWPGAT